MVYWLYFLCAHLRFIILIIMVNTLDGPLVYSARLRKSYHTDNQGLYNTWIICLYFQCANLRCNILIIMVNTLDGSLVYSARLREIYHSEYQGLYIR